MKNVAIVTSEDIQKAVIKALEEYGLKPAPKEIPTYTINQVAKRLSMAHNTVKKLVMAGVIRSTSNGRIPEDAIEDYLEGR